MDHNDLVLLSSKLENCQEWINRYLETNDHYDERELNQKLHNLQLMLDELLK